MEQIVCRVGNAADDWCVRSAPDGSFTFLATDPAKSEESFEYFVSNRVHSISRRISIQIGVDGTQSDLNKLRQIGLTELSFSSGLQLLFYPYEGLPFPPRPRQSELLSWRVYLLPSLGQIQLFEKFNLSEPWDSPTNLPLLAEMPDIFRSSSDGAGTTKTRFNLVTSNADSGSGPYQFFFQNNYRGSIGLGVAQDGNKKYDSRDSIRKR